MKEYLLDFFNFNNNVNLKMIEKIGQLPDPSESIRLFSHLINSQYKWMARIRQEPNTAKMSWWDPVYLIDELETEWIKSVNLWLAYILSLNPEELSKEVTFTGYDGGVWAATPTDIALQLNYHSIHHRAQIQTIIRSQGLEPDFVEYIGMRYRKMS